MPSSEVQDDSSENTSGEDVPDVAAPDTDIAEEDVPSEDASGGEDPPGEQVVETVECPNCGRAFVGDYCPECGQEANPSASVTGVVGGFFREFIDLESGFWPTFVGLTLRPGEVLQQYLSGVRAGLISPGRYLLAAVVVGVGVEQFLAWIGAGDPPWAESEAPTSSNGTASGGAGAEEGFDKALDVAVHQVLAVFEGPQARTAGILLVTGLLAALLYRLFRDGLEEIGEALATGSFLVAHGMFLGRGAELLYVGAAFLYIGQPAESPDSFSLAILFGYIGLASYQCFGPGWKSGLKGVFAVTWAFVETVLVLMTAGILYAGGLVLLYPGSYVPTGGTSGEALVKAALLGLVVAIPLLLHAGVELYYRLR